MNPWHDVKIGEQSPKIVNTVIEVPKGSRNKYEIDKDCGLLRLDRTLYSSIHYPANYGFIPRTFAEDFDPLDILVLGQEAVFPMTIVSARPIGVMRMMDEGQIDDKIIAVHVNDPENNDYEKIADLPKHRLIEIRNFFEDYKNLERKKVEVGDILNAERAFEIIERSINAYQQKYKRNN